jgi:hypothetical protein
MYSLKFDPAATEGALWAEKISVESQTRLPQVIFDELPLRTNRFRVKHAY